jgi:beta-glucosidase
VIDQNAVSAKVQALLSQMTLEEKAGQMRQYFCFGDQAYASPRLAAEAAKMEAAINTGMVGSLLFVSKAEQTNALQKRHLAASRLKIPLLFGFDVIHGFKTIFPVPLAMAASWDPDLATQCQAVAAKEARAVGIHWTFAPMVDIARDPRWGRIVEGAGEDPFLGAVMAVAQVKGFQGDGFGSKHVISGPKHFAGYGASLGGRDYDEVNLSDYELHNVYLTPFKAAVEAGAGNIMTAYMPLNGIPATANAHLFTDILRTNWGFKGFVVSDANAAINLVQHGFSKDATASAVAALSAGLDLEMTTGTSAYEHLVEAVQSGMIDEAALDQAVTRILEAKVKLGLLDSYLVDEAEAERILASPEHRELARSAAARCAVLLRNEGALLPLSSSAHKKVAVLGPLADSRRDILGPWVFEQDLSETVAIFQGLEETAPESVQVTFAPGVALPARLNPWPFGMMHPYEDDDIWADFDEAGEFERAITLAEQSDVAVLVLGERFDMSGEIASRSSLELPGNQLDLLKAIVATGKPVVLLVMSGRPLDLVWANNNVPAIMQIWHGGTKGGDGVADLLFGRASPAGRLPFSWPRSVGQIPLIYSHLRSHDPSGQTKRYWDEDGTPLYEFGYGLSYTSFSYADLLITQAPTAATFTVSCTVTNGGSVDSDDVVQLYIGQKYGSSVRPVRELKGFQRVNVKAGVTCTVTFTIGPNELAHWNARTRDWIVDKAEFDVWVGGSSVASLHAQFQT